MGNKATRGSKGAVDHGSAGSRQVHVAPLDEDEYTRLDTRATLPADLPAFAIGKSKNRYKDVLPNNLTRVKLQPLPGDQTGDTTYVNANWVHSSKSARHASSKAYIAAQGPLPSSLNAFVRMLWETDTAIIVMLTRIVEAGRRKCEPYWNEDRPEEFKKFGEISVRMAERHKRDDYELNVMELKRGDNTRRVAHFWYTTWPDHSVPVDEDGNVDPTGLLGMLGEARHVRETKAGKHQPMLVHCSAGIGRTGTFIALDHAADAIDAGKPVDLCQIIDLIRRDRMALVQHESQYVFLHEAVLEYAADAVVVASTTQPQQHSRAVKSPRWSSIKIGEREVLALDRKAPRYNLSQHKDRHAFQPTESEAEHSVPGSPERRRRKLSQTVDTHPYFRPDLSREQVENLLANAPNGTFVVRNSSRSGSYALSVQQGAHVAHLLITHTESVPPKYTLADDPQQREYDSLEDLVDHFRSHTIVRGQDGSVKLK